MDYGDVDLDLLFVLERVLSRQSVSLAANDLGLSQSATSRALQRLRDALGDPILVRAGAGMVPTERAQELLPLAVAALDAAGAVFDSESQFDPAHAEGVFVVALGSENQVAFAGALLEAVHREVPGVGLRFRSVGQAAVDEGRRGVLDLAVVPILSSFPFDGGGIDLGEFVVQPLYQRKFCLAAARRRWPEPPDLESYLSARHVIVSFDGGERGFVDAVLHELGHSRRVVASVSSFAAMGHVVANSEALAVMPLELARSIGQDLVTHPLPFELPAMPMMLVWHPRQRSQPRHRFLRDLIARVLTERVEQLTGGVPVVPTAP